MCFTAVELNPAVNMNRESQMVDNPVPSEEEPNPKVSLYGSYSSSSDDDDFTGFLLGETDVKCIKTCSNKSSNGKLQCYKCKEEFHYECLNMSGSSFKCITKAATLGSRWHCETCLNATTPKSVFGKIPAANNNQTSLVGLKELSKQLENVKNELKKEIRAQKKSYAQDKDELKREIREQKKSYAQVTKKSLDNETKRVNQMSSISKNLKIVSSSIATSIETSNAITNINKSLKSVKAKIDKKAEHESEKLSHELRALNICVFNIPESDADSLEEQYKEDVKKFKEVISSHVTLEKEDVKAFFRIGRERQPTKARPILLKLSNEDARLKLLKLRNLKFNDDTGEYDIYINPDRTKKEQDEHRKLLAELRERRSNGEENIIIKNGKIIQVLPFRQNPQSYWG